MGNMSYCRFQNTFSDFEDCKDAILGMTSGEGGALEGEELRYAKRLIESAFELVGILNEQITDGPDIEGLDEVDTDELFDQINEQAKLDDEDNDED